MTSENLSDTGNGNEQFKFRTMKTIEEKINEIIEHYDLSKTDTTTGMNGYPEWTNMAFYCDKRSDLEAAAEKIRDLGCEVCELWMKRRDGQHFWNRENSPFIITDLKQASDQDWTITVNTNDQEEEIKSEIRERLFGTPEEMGENYFPDEEVVEQFYSDIPKGEGECVIFYDPYNKSVNYIVTDESTGYHDGDVTSYRMGFSIELPEEEEE